MFKLPVVDPVKIALVGGAVVALAAVVFVVVRKAGGDKRSPASMLSEEIAKALAKAAGDAVVGTGVGAVKGIGAAVGIPDTSTDKCAAAKAAGATWDASLYCTAGDFLSWTKSRIFGGSDAGLNVPVSTSPTDSQTIRPTLRRGDTGNAVRELQGKLGIAQDGIFGSGTEAAVKKFQTSKLLNADGVVGVQTWAALDNGFAVVTQDGILTDSAYRELIH